LEQDSVGNGRFAAIVKMGKQMTIISTKTLWLIYTEFAFLIKKSEKSMINGSFIDEDYRQLQLKNIGK